jgi:hypothetical protein
LGGVVAAPALLRQGEAEAQGVAPQRLLIIHRPCGTRLDEWFPSGGTTDWTSRSPMLSAFDKLRGDMVVMKGVDCPRKQDWYGNKNGAGMIAMMAPPPMDRADNHVWPVLPGFTVAQQNDTNARFFTSPDKTIDQLLLEKIPSLRAAPIPSMQLTASIESADQTRPCCDHVISYAKPDASAPFPTPLWPEVRPSVALANLVGPMGVTPDIAAKNQALNKSLLDFVSGDLNRIRSRLPSSQVPKIDAHLTALRSLEMSVTSAPRPCTPPTLAPLPMAMPPQVTLEDARYQPCCEQMSQIIKTAFQCDLTRVISFTFGCYVSPLHFSVILPAGTVTDTGAIGDIAHNGGTGYAQAQEAIDTFFCQSTANLLLDLKNTPDGSTGGSLLDNTLVVFWSEVSVGNPSDTKDMPILAFGGKFLQLNAGNYLQFGDHARTMADFWVATAQAWGYPALTQYGDAMWNKGPMTGLYG